MRKTKYLLSVLIISVAAVFTAGILRAPAFADTSEYVIRYDKNDGSGKSKTQHAECGQTVNLLPNGYAITGYTFTGWTTNPDGTGTTYSNRQAVKDLAAPGGTVNLYARWRANTYTVYFDPGGGTGTMDSVKFTYGVTKALPKNTFKKKGYTFIGWNNKADLTGRDYKDGASLTKARSGDNATMTLYAKWRPNTYTVSFDPNGGTGTMSPEKFTYGVTQALTLNAFTRKGYTFAGWNNKADLTGTNYKDGASLTRARSGDNAAMTLYAKWKGNPYTIILDPNNGNSGTLSVKCTYGISRQLPLSPFTYSGHILTGWNTKADGTGKHYKDGAVFKALTSKANGKVTLYAEWASEYDVILKQIKESEWSPIDPDISKRMGSAERISEEAFTRISGNYRAAYDALLEAGVENGMDQMTAFGKIRDWICANCTYDYSYSHKYWDDVLESGTATCNGYSGLLQVMCRMCGIECYRQHGHTSSGGFHGWNRLRLNGEWYYADLTWYDTNKKYDLTTVLYEGRTTDAEYEELDRSRYTDDIEYMTIQYRYDSNDSPARQISVKPAFSYYADGTYLKLADSGFTPPAGKAFAYWAYDPEGSSKAGNAGDWVFIPADGTTFYAVYR